MWAWKRGSGEFTPYDPEISARIEGAHAVGDKGVIIHLPAAYRIDFGNMCQINLGDASKRRSIVRLNALDATVEMPRRTSRTDGNVIDIPSKVRKALQFCSGSADWTWHYSVAAASTSRRQTAQSILAPRRARQCPSV